MTCGSALEIYAEEHAINVADPQRIGYAIDALDPYFGDLTIAEVTRTTSMGYAKRRKSSVWTIRRELGVLQAAINHCFQESYLLSPKNVHMPPAPEANDRWLTRQEAAWLLRGARALNRDGRHLQDFIQHGLYTGSRKKTILAMHINIESTFGGTVDTVNGVLYRKPKGKVATNKKQGTARLPPRYLAQLRRQAANGRRYVVERTIVRFEGDQRVTEREMIADIRKGWSRAVQLAEQLAKNAGIELDLRMGHGENRKPITPHVLKHTAITWSLQKGAKIWDAAGYFDTSPATIEKTYGHHSPDHQSSAIAAIDRRV